MSRLTTVIAVAAILLPFASLPAQDNDEPKRYVGEFTEEEVISHDEQYADGVFTYIPDEGALAIFKAVSQPVIIKVFYRTDCIDSIHHVPPFIKTIQLADNPNIEVQYIGVNRPKDKPAELLEGWDIKLVPTFIVLHESEEVGRVIETPKVKIEVDLAELLRDFVN